MENFIKYRGVDNQPTIVVVTYEYYDPPFPPELPELPDFKLEASIIQLENADKTKLRHSVAGLMCNGIPYIYDSTNYVAQTDWPNGNLGEYMDVLVEEGYSGFTPFASALVYIDHSRIPRNPNPTPPSGPMPSRRSTTVNGRRITTVNGRRFTAAHV
jgi:hypothetical protein